jgi:hypothetical protein
VFDQLAGRGGREDVRQGGQFQRQQQFAAAAPAIERRLTVQNLALDQTDIRATQDEQDVESIVVFQPTLAFWNCCPAY